MTAPPLCFACEARRDSPNRQIDAFLGCITKDDLAAMPPANRRRLAQALRHIANIADPRPKCTVEIPKAGILRDLGNGARAESS